MRPNISCESLTFNEMFDEDLRRKQNFQKTFIESVPSLEPIVRFKKKRPQGRKPRFKGLEKSEFIFGPINSVNL